LDKSGASVFGWAGQVAFALLMKKFEPKNKHWWNINWTCDLTPHDSRIHNLCVKKKWFVFNNMSFNLLAPEFDI
jgi:hypothetical protein